MNEQGKYCALVRPLLQNAPNYVVILEYRLVSIRFRYLNRANEFLTFLMEHMLFWID